MSLVKEGYVLKQGEKIKSWRKRYLMVYQERAQLRFDYFKTQGASEPQGSFGLSPSSQFRLISPPASPLPVSVMEITTPFRVYLLSAESEAEVKEWVWVIEKLQAHLQLESARPRAGSDANVRSGYLYKKGAKRRNWKRRLFVLSGRMLRYYPNSDKMKEALGEVDLSLATDVHKEYVNDGTSDQRFMFSIDTPGRTFFMAAHSESEMESWLRSLVRAGLHVQNTPSGRHSRFYAAESASDDDEDIDFKPGAVEASGASAPKEAWPFLAPAGLSLPFPEIHRIFRPRSC